MELILKKLIIKNQKKFYFNKDNIIYLVIIIFQYKFIGNKFYLFF